MTKRGSPKTPWETDFKPYAEAIGYLVREWNGLQNAFLKLFGVIVANPNRSAAMSIWHTIQNDRLQRQILAAVAAKAFDETSSPDRLLESEDEATMRHLLTEIIWCMQRADGLGKQRDDAIHTRLSLVASDPITFVSNTFFDHPRAKSLKGKDLLKEFSSYREDMETLTQYVEHIHKYIRSRLLPQTVPALRPSLPQRPVSPSDSKKSREAKERPKGHKKSPSPPPSSSWG